MVDISILDSLPEINLLADEEITLESMINEMVNDYEVKYEELTGEELILYPANEYRIMLSVVAGKLFQLAEIMNDRFQQNFIKYMYGEYTKNWAANLGFLDTGVESAKVKLLFTLSETQNEDITIPQGTRATAGDDVFFSTDEVAVIVAGNNSVEIDATCSEPGTIGNDYSVGKIAIIADPINYVAEVKNTTISSGGHDEYTNKELKEKVLNFPNTYSTAGPVGCYEDRVMEYSSSIVDAKVLANDEAVVKIYIMLSKMQIPNAEYCQAVLDYVKALKVCPDTDLVEIYAPEKVGYNLKLKYYINDEKKNIQEGINDAIIDVVNTFTEYTASKVGRAINPDLLVGYALAAGASRVVIETPEFQTITEIQIAICDNIEIEFGGFEME